VVALTEIGVLALQGSVAEHLKLLSQMEGIKGCEVKTREQLGRISGLILPGGESTTIGKLLKEYRLEEPLVEMARKGMPIWGTCAGMILLAKEITNEDYIHLGIMDMAVRRNAYGGQLDSFRTDLHVPAVAEHEIPLVFIRAPWVERIWGNAETIAEIGEKIVAVRQGNLIATSFHPELTDDLSFHQYFCKLAKAWVG
jgi:5'-phosphate synthase pdxT subunit